MYLKSFFTAFLAALLLSSAFLANGAEKKKEQIKKQKQKTQTAANPVWHSDLKKALAEAKKGRKYILLVHTAPAVNEASKLFDQQIVKSKSLAKITPRVVLVKFEYEDMKNITPAAKAAAEKYKIKNQDNKLIMPTVYLLDSAGNALDARYGFSGENTPESYLKGFKVLKDFGKNTKTTNNKKSKKSKDKKKSKK